MIDSCFKSRVRLLFRAFPLRVSVITVCLLTSPAVAAAAELSVNPTDGQFDQPVSIRIAGLRPDELVTLTLTAKDASGALWSSEATYHASIDGVLDPSSVAPLSGSYSGIDGMGLFWSMHPPAGYAGHFPTLWAVDPEIHAREAQEYEITATAGGTVVGKSLLRERFIAPDVEVSSVRQAGLVADLYYPAEYAKDGRHHAAVIT